MSLRTTKNEKIHQKKHTFLVRKLRTYSENCRVEAESRRTWEKGTKEALTLGMWLGAKLSQGAKAPQ